MLMLTPEQDEARSCLPKRIYFSLQEAQEERARAWTDEGVNIGEPYPCRYCPWWHTGLLGRAHPTGRWERVNQRLLRERTPLLS